MVAVFDTAFHQTMPPKAYLLWTSVSNTMRSTQYVSTASTELPTALYPKRPSNSLDWIRQQSKVIVCHLGNGASISAVENGKCVDTSMGLTPLEGLIMGTRSGDLDPAVLEFVCKKENMTMSRDGSEHPEQGVRCLWHCQAVCPATSVIWKRQWVTVTRAAKLAIDAFCYRVAKYVGSYVAAMNGVDAIAFTGGIGENADVVRAEGSVPILDISESRWIRK